MTADLDLKAIATRNAARTQGVWTYWTIDVMRDWQKPDEGMVDAGFVNGWTTYPDPECTHLCVADAAWIAACSQDVPALLAEIERLQRELLIANGHCPKCLKRNWLTNSNSGIATQSKCVECGYEEWS